MKSAEYRAIVKTIAKSAIKKGFPGIKINALVLETVALSISRNIHARMYGANVDGVNSPLWRDDKLPDVDASELLEIEAAKLYEKSGQLRSTEFVQQLYEGKIK